jgi:hypothetical protein
MAALNTSPSGKMLRAAALRSLSSAGVQARSRLLPRQQVRFGSGGGGGGPRGYGSGEYRGLKVPVPEKWQSNVATVYATMMWLWIFHRFRHDGKAMLVRQAARTRSGRLRLLPWVVRAEPPPAAQELICPVPRRTGSRASLGRASLTRRPTCALRAAAAHVCRLRLEVLTAIDCSLCAW